jgi:SAM-dependent methyltransferase
MLETISKGWDQAAREDAMFNILTIPGKEGGRWTAEEFFEHGRQEIDYVIERLDRLGFRGEKRRTAVDFGCGVGRLTQALQAHYEVAFGIDASGEMVHRANALAFERKADRVIFFHNEKPNLKFIQSGTADMVYSMITLQHMPNELQKAYVQEFMRDWVRGAGGKIVDIELTVASTDVYSGWRYTARRA